MSAILILDRPKYVANLGAVIRAASSFGAQQIYWSGKRIDLDANDRLPREMRMQLYKDVRVTRTERPFDKLTGEYTAKITPVCVELVPGAESLADFVHPPNAAYVFGPEDGDVSQVYRRLCHRFVYIPSRHCLNLAAAVNIVLYDRATKEI